MEGKIVLFLGISDFYINNRDFSLSSFYQYETNFKPK
jgi:hypothetical protein